MSDPSNINWVAGAMQYIVFVMSTTVHEAAHAWTAYRLGDRTAYHGGQVTLDPTPHIKRAPVGMVVVPLLTFFVNGSLIGWASTPYDPEWALRNPRYSAWMALAGPVANAVMFLAAAMAMLVGIRAGVFTTPDRFGWMSIAVTAHGGFWPFIAAMLSLVFSMNILLCFFNLLPLPPLDGAAIPLLFLGDHAGRVFMTFVQQPAFSWIGLFVGWKVFGSVFPAVWNGITALLFGG